MPSIASSKALRSGTETVTVALEQARRSRPGRFFVAWGELRASEAAILIAWQLLFSLFPMVVGLLWIFGRVLREPERQAAIAESIVQQFPAQASDLLGFMNETRDLSGLLGLVSLLWLLWSGANLFGTMATVFDRFYGVPHRSFYRERLVSFAMIAVYAVLVTVSVAASSLTGFLVGLSNEVLPFEVPNAALVIGWLVSAVSAILMFLVLYRFIPNVRLRVWNVWKGAVLAGILFVLLTQIFPLYLRFVGAGYAAYKALGGFLLLMTWLYFVGHILCIGALLNAVMTGHCPPTTSEIQAASERAARLEVAERDAEPPGGPVKRVVWTGLTAAVTALMLLLARQAARGLWRSLTRQEPPA